MDFRKLCRIACVFLLIFFFQGNALAATIHGTVYEWDSFKPLNNTIIEVNSTPKQSLVATDANYSFNLTPGTYLITADYFEGTNRVYSASERVVISDQGEYVRDFLLFPSYEEELLSRNGSEPAIQNVSAAETAQSAQPAQLAQAAQPMQPVSQPQNEINYLAAAALAFVIVALIGLYLLHRSLIKRSKKAPEIVSYFPPGGEGFSKKNEDIKRLEAGTLLKEAEFSERDLEETDEETSEKTDEEIPEENSEDDLDDGFEIKSSLPESAETGEAQEDRKLTLPDDLKELLEMIRANGNRITQRELRKKSPYSESKVSLMLSDLEERGLIEKFKRGRGNIIRIPDEHISKQTEAESKQE